MTMTQAQTERTVGPWKAIEVRTSVGRAFRIGSGEMLKAGKGCCIIYDDYPGNPDNERAANARFIVTACNAHDELVAALRLIDRILDGAAKTGQAPRLSELNRIKGTAESALAKLDSAQQGIGRAA